MCLFEVFGCFVEKCVFLKNISVKVWWVYEKSLPLHSLSGKRLLQGTSGQVL